MKLITEKVEINIARFAGENGNYEDSSYLKIMRLIFKIVYFLFFSSSSPLSHKNNFTKFSSSLSASSIYDGFYFTKNVCKQ